ncbi:MAG TPA: flagellar basal-body MS-ring/collar protein FliF [Gammaproteobacteria bacterium]|nr:flagellar basal-body MS-ring/collar protein FliF [Gammaproteobacteria bacterium]
MADATVFVEQNSPMALLRQAGVLIGIAAAVALGVWVVMWSRTPSYEMLYSDLSDRDMTQIADALKSTQIRYRIEPDSGALLVQADKADDAKLQLAAAGLPKGGARGAELIEEPPAFGTSQFMEKARYQRAIEEELARSVARIDNVRAARVHLALPAETVFARARKEPSASVMVDLYAGRVLDAAQVAAITHLVSASVPNLPSSRVTVVDSRGNLLTDAKRDKLMALTAQRFEYTRKLEEDYVERIRKLLEPMVGPDGVRAQVTADLDFTETERTSESYNPDLQAVRSEKTVEEERTGGGPGGVPGALSNTPPEQATAPEQTAAAPTAGAEGAVPAAPAATSATQPNSKRSQVVRNYEVDRTIAHTKPSVGSIRKLSVAVVLRKPAPPAAIDGAATAPDAAAEPNASATSAPPAKEFTAEEIARMTQLVKDAVGFDPARGDTVTLMPASFIDPTPPEPLPAQPVWKQPWVWDIGKQALGGLFVLMLFFGLLRPAIRALTAKPTMALDAGRDGAAQAALPPGANPAALALPNGSGAAAQAGSAALAGPIALPSTMHDNLDQLKDIVSKDPRVAAQVIKNWVGES